MTHHFTLASRGRRTIARGEVELRAVVRAIARMCGKRLLLHAVVDDHVHVVARTERAWVLGRESVRAIRLAVPGVELQSAHVTPVESRIHLERLVGYLLAQPRRHDLPVHPALWTGSCLLDLVQARILPGFELTALVEELPRLRLRSLMTHVGLKPERLVPAADADLLRAGAARIVELSAAVYALPPELGGRRSEIVTARSLAVQLARSVGLPPGAIVPFLGVSDRQARRLAARPLDPRGALALRRRLALELRVRSRG